MDKLRLGVVGVGSVVREIYQHLYFRSEYTDILEVVGVADPNPEYRTWFAETFGIPADRCFADYAPLLETLELDVVQVNTPDHIHAAPTVAALEAGLDAIVPKPTAATVKDAHAMIDAVRRTGRFLGVDYHKRRDPRILEVASRYRSGRYGQLQSAVWYMVDKLLVADPNHEPPFFASRDFAERNTPISFLTVHMCDALLTIVDLKPVEVRATGWKQKLPSLTPVACDGYDLCDTEVRLANGALAHIVTGWHLPNTAHATTVQSSRLICSGGLVDLSLDRNGVREIHAEALAEVNPLFKTFEASGRVSGYGIDSPGRLYRHVLADRNGRLDAATRAALLTPAELGFWTTAVCEAAEKSLAAGVEVAPGVVNGEPVGIREMLEQELGDAAGQYLG